MAQGSKQAVDKIVQKPLVDLKLSEHNAREHPQSQIEQIAASIKEFGWTMPILIDEADEVIAGHGRLLAGLHLGLKTAPVLVAASWTEAQKRAYRVADNKLAEGANWDLEALSAELLAIKTDLNFDIEVIGFDVDALSTQLSEVSKQFGQLIKAAVDVSDDIEGTMVSAIVRPKRFAGNLQRIHFFGGFHDLNLAKALFLQTAHAASE